METKKEKKEGMERPDLFQLTPVESPSENYLVIEQLQRLPSLVSRGLLYLIIAALVCVLIYSLVVEVERVAVCRAIAMPTTQLSIHAERSGYIERVFVSEGQMVEKNKPLFVIRLKEASSFHTSNLLQYPDPLTGKVMQKKESAKDAPGASASVHVTGEESPPPEESEGVIKALHAGTIVKLFLKNPGEYVEASAPLCTLIPTQEQLSMDILVTNRDIGFIERDMEIHYKFDAFPYSDYGVLYGKVISIPSAALEDRAFGVVYHVQGTLEKPHFEIKGKRYSLKSGMTATAELVKEKKSIFSIVFRKLS